MSAHGGVDAVALLVRFAQSRPVVNGKRAFLVRAMSTAIDVVSNLCSVPDDLAATMLALGSQGMNSTLEAVEIV